VTDIVERLRGFWGNVSNRDIIEAADEIERLREAVDGLLRAVCGPTGFANAVREHSGVGYPWPSLDEAEARARAALPKGSKDV
jgi:hypothetical protein